MIGINFSPWYCEQLELDPWDTFINLLNNLNPDIVRLSAYWNRIQPAENIYEFDELEKYIAELNKRNIKIVLTVGINAQRWPEFFIPAWLLKNIDSPKNFQIELNKPGSIIQNYLLKFITQTVKKFDSKIDYWQIENEPFQQSFPLNFAISKDFLLHEIITAKTLSTKPIVLNESIALNKLFAFLKTFSKTFGLIKSVEGLSDIFAANIYVRASFNIFGIKTNFKQNGYPDLPKNVKKVAITEVQSEPWPLPKLSSHVIKKELWELIKLGDWKAIAKESKDYGILATSVDKADSSMMNEAWNAVSKINNWEFILFWGSEYWWARYLKGDEEWIAKYLLIKS